MDNQIKFIRPTICYLWRDLFGYPDTKIGLTGVHVLHIRTATYDTPLGLRTHAEFPYFWIGEEEDSVEFEGQMLSQYDEQRPDRRPGMTEWIKDSPWDSVRDFGNRFIERNGFKMYPMDPDLKLNNIFEDQVEIKRRYLSAIDFRKWGFERQIDLKKLNDYATF